MPKIMSFEKYSVAYEEWFEKNLRAYQTELRAIEEMLPDHGKGLEIGVGSGQFAEPLGIEIGIDPSPQMAELARAKGIRVIDAVAEALPFENDQFDFALMVTTICFVDDPDQAFREASRVLKTGGEIIVGFVDRESDLGKQYLEKKSRSRFYNEAVFYSVQEVVDSLKQAGFGHFQSRQTLFKGPTGMTSVEASSPGYGKGAFVVVRGSKSKA